MFVVCRFPYAAVEKEEYRSFTGSKTGRKSLAACVRGIHDEYKKKLAENLRKATVTLGVDGWSNCRKEKIVNVVALTGEATFFLESYEMEEGETGAELSKTMLEAIDHVKGMGGRVIAVVTDNAANMVNA